MRLLDSWFCDLCRLKIHGLRAVVRKDYKVIACGLKEKELPEGNPEDYWDFHDSLEGACLKRFFLKKDSNKRLSTNCKPSKEVV